MSKENRIIVEGMTAYSRLNKTPESDRKYSMTLLFPKDKEESINKIKNAIEWVKVNHVDKWGGKVPHNLKLPLHDGDEERPDKETFKNCYYLNANSTNMPGIVDRNLNTIENPAEIYSGCLVNVSLILYGYNTNGNKGIAVCLCNIQKIKDGPRYSHKRIEAWDEFKVIE